MTGNKEAPAFQYGTTFGYDGFRKRCTYGVENGRFSCDKRDADHAMCQCGPWHDGARRRL